MARRKSTGKRQRFNIFKRDKFTCQYCGRTPPAVVLVIDHIVPVASGGGEEITNKVTACETCNQGKAAGSLSDVPQAIESQLAAQVERQEQLAEYNKFLMKLRAEQAILARQVGSYWCDRINPPADKGLYTFSVNRISSVTTFMKFLPVTVIYEAIDIAFSRKPASGDGERFKYFCGICWSKIKAANPEAKA